MKYFLIILVSFSTFVTQGQNDHNIESKGNEFYSRGQYKASLSYLSRINFNSPDSTRCITLSNRANAYKKLRNTTNALSDFKALIKNCKTTKADLLSYGKLLMSCFDYTKAKKIFQYVENQYKDSTAALYKLSCDSALIWIDKIPNYQTINLKSINTQYEELSPKLTNDLLVFSSTREGTIIKRKSQATYQPSYSFFKAKLDGQKFMKPKAFSSFINSSNHEVSMNFSQGGNEIFFTRLSMQDENSSGENTLRLFHSIKSGDYWSKPEHFIYNSDTCSNAHPTVSNDGNMMFFTSDRKGGYGGLDLYVCIRKNKTWSTPLNLGPNINTPYDETFPCYIGDSTLYFSSNGHPGMGGFDIFKSKKSNGTWSVPMNLRSPINSGQNELSYFEDRNTGRIFISSDRDNGIGGLDLYEIKRIR